MKDLTLIINIKIYESTGGGYSLMEDHNAHPDILFIGGSCYAYTNGDEILQKQRVIDALHRQAPNRRIAKVIYNLDDQRKKQATLAQFF